MEGYERRPRVATACEVCRKRKRKCDGVRPCCSWCQSNKKKCEYSEENPRKRKLDDAYVADLEAQITLLQEHIRSLESSNNNTFTSTASAAAILSEGKSAGTEPAFSPVPLAGSTISSSNDRLGTPSSEGHASAINDVSSMMWRMKIQEDGETSFTGPSGNFCFPARLHELNSHREPGRKAPLAAEVLYRSRPTVTEAVKNHLLDVFARSINQTHQFLDQATLEDLAQETPSCGELLECAVLSAAAVFSDTSEMRKTGDELSMYMNTITLHYCHRNPDVSTVQALSIMAWRELALDHENMAWMFNSMSASLCLHLGLHVSSLETLNDAAVSAKAPSTKDPQHQRIRAFWSSFFIDRIATSLLGRNCMIPWRRVQAAPFSSAVGSSPSLDEVLFAAQCRLWFIHDQYMDRIYSFEFESLGSHQRRQILLEAREELINFYRQLDSRLELHRGSNPPNVLHLHITYNGSQLLIHRPYLREDSQGSIYRLALHSMSTAASAIARLVREHQKLASFENSPPFVAHSILTAAVALLLGATNSLDQARHRSINRFRTCFNALDTMQASLPLAKRAITLLRELAQRWHILIALPICYSFPLSIPDTADSPEDELNSEGFQEASEKELDDSSIFEGPFDPDIFSIDPTAILEEGLFDFSTPNW